MNTNQHRRQQHQQGPSDPNHQPPTNQDAQKYSQVPPLQFGVPDLTGNSLSNLSGQTLTTQPTVLTPASDASFREALQQNHLYAIQASVEPVARDSSDDSDFFESLNRMFAHEGNNVSQLDMESNVQYLMDPLAWLQKESPPADTVTLPMVPETKIVPPHNEQSTLIARKYLAANKTSNLKPALAKAAAGKIKSAMGGSKKRRQIKSGSGQVAPFDFLKNLLAERGYSFATIKSIEAGYLTDPSPLQLASFGTKLVNAVHTSNIDVLSSLLGCGLSPNPCNQFHDSTLGWVCKKAQDSVFRCFLDHKAELRVCDGFGRTPLHQAAWADRFSPTIVLNVLQRDPVQLFLEDNSNRTPLEYVPSRLATQWIGFIDNHKEELFPRKGPPLAVTKGQRLQLPDPPNAISVDLARLLSSGQIEPEQIAALDTLTRKTWTIP